METIVVTVVILVVLSVIVVSMFICADIVYKDSTGKNDKPSYILEFEQELAKADIKLGNSMTELREEVSQVVAKELPKVVANGKNYMYLALETNPDDNYREYSVVKVIEAQYNLIKRHRWDEEWLGNTIFSKEIGLYASIVFCSDNYNGVLLDIR